MSDEQAGKPVVCERPQPLKGFYVIFYAGAPYPTDLNNVDPRIYQITKQQGEIRVEMKVVEDWPSVLTDFKPRNGGRLYKDNVIYLGPDLEKARAVMTEIANYREAQSSIHIHAKRVINTLLES